MLGVLDSPGIGGEEGIREALIPRIQFPDAKQYGAESEPGVVGGAALGDDRATRRHLVGEGGLHERLPGREAPVQRRRPHPRAACDLAHRHLEATLGEETPGSLEDPLAVVRGIRPQ